MERGKKTGGERKDTKTNNTITFSVFTDNIHEMTCFMNITVHTFVAHTYVRQNKMSNELLLMLI